MIVSRSAGLRESVVAAVEFEKASPLSRIIRPITQDEIGSCLSGVFNSIYQR
jgi:hypothetical protein